MEFILRLIHKLYMLKADSEKRGQTQERRFKTHEKGRFSFNSILNDSFEDIFLKCGNEFQSDGPARANAWFPPPPPKTYYIQVHAGTTRKPESAERSERTGL